MPKNFIPTPDQIKEKRFMEEQASQNENEREKERFEEKTKERVSIHPIEFGLSVTDSKHIKRAYISLSLPLSIHVWEEAGRLLEKAVKREEERVKEK